MKSAKDPRHKRRRRIVKELFANSFGHRQAEEDTREIEQKIPILDEEIKTSAPQWPIDKLNKIDLSILRLAVFELLFTDTPPKVTIDEAVELAKEYGGDSSPSFVNGVLGDVLKRKEEKERNE